jgi:hypothetical protein
MNSEYTTIKGKMIVGVITNSYNNTMVVRTAAGHKELCWLPSNKNSKRISAFKTITDHKSAFHYEVFFQDGKKKTYDSIRDVAKRLRIANSTAMSHSRTELPIQIGVSKGCSIKRIEVKS